MQKTNAMRILDKSKIEYNALTYDASDGHIDGAAVAKKTGQDPETVYKTLVTMGNSRNLYVFVIPVLEELDLKKCAKVSGEKKLEMIHVKDINKFTGYIRGGCSPLGMKKQYDTFVQEEALKLDKIVFSGGKIGLQIEMDPKDLEKVIKVKFEDVIKR
ncbi:aminoacyl-tRNA deacylase [Clostridium baratii]|uniref:Cys-tRNA(Pro)/Cys-tRNA(Cys) deacylase n=3 Tax=Clostridium TaxID=1485 RepID=A0A0A7FZ95_9CLOT|nr:Cys-tRNA(Pro) deacylase [Clostridium baratii]AIY84176.1 aminoacyl-tRNA editing domain protein [Clostridium baratii str. Sullivan]KJU71871.1 cysteinyl-tRNA(Pro) deacylase [Clostridium baratii]MBS6007780.1 Cys-tRNA(Pro) deacylase [Clostridium baratii]MBS6041270.1 Cys-tRNA(Pro) deacylase [Clostridium baratii]MBT9830946.1 Cys-tRNA(Pro) deacylase [Clostridium baratii]